MILKANITEALRSLVSAKQRTILALIGIVIGIGSVIGMVSIGSIVQNEALKQFKDMGVDIATVRKDSGEKGSEMALKDILGLKGRGDVTEVAPYLTSGTEYGSGSKKMFMEQMGVTESFFDLNKIVMKRGRRITDLDAYRYFCVIGTETEQFLNSAGTPDPIGSRIALGDRIYTIVGVMGAVSEGGMRPYGINRSVITHITTGTRSFQSKEINTFMVRLAGLKAAPEVKAEFQDYFEKKSNGLRVSVNTAEELIASMKKQMQLFSLLLGAIGSIALIVGGIGVMNVMLISVTERRKEIGLRRALGAQQMDIQAQFIIESVTLCLAGGIIGIFLGIGVSLVFAKLSKWEFLVSYGSIALGFGVATAVGIFFGYYPARQAARLDPIKALRS
ncbi:MAG: ABC transporter permease [Syntrophales bacterium]|nr:ABC transporter permease [Syntrophales bacterium]MDD5533208.1 ABC transporter permease [Syntrophales bacterium]